MSDRDRPDIPNWVFNAGEKIQSSAKKIPLDWLINAFAGSSSPNYIQVEWHKVDQVVDAVSEQPAELPVALGDPDATLLSLIPRFKNKAAVLGSNFYQIQLLAEDHPENAAVAFTYRGQTRVGILPRGILDFAIKADTLNCQAAIRMGRNDVRAGIGVWIPKEKVLLKPTGTEVVAQNIPISDLPDKFYATPLV